MAAVRAAASRNHPAVTQRLFSDRLPPQASANAIALEVAALRAAGVPFADLTVSDPTMAGFVYPADLLAGLGDVSALSYQPEPRGRYVARAAVARDCARRGAVLHPEQIILAASTSEAYSWLFKLLCNPGERVLIPRPSYPLFEHLTRLEGIATSAYDLEYHGRWEIDFARVQAAPDDTRAVLVVSPNNPTGSYISRREWSRLSEICRERGWAVIVDEVFADYPLEAADTPTDLAAGADVLTFTLGGASKSLGLPQVKLGWMVVGGPDASRLAALDALELIADSFLSVGTPVQVAAATLLTRGAAIRQQIRDRVRHNLTWARSAAAAHPACELLRVDGGWSAILRIPATRSEEAFVLDLLQRERILVHPGYFFDLPHEAYVVVSLLPVVTTFADAFSRLLRHADA